MALDKELLKTRIIELVDVLKQNTSDPEVAKEDFAEGLSFAINEFVGEGGDPANFEPANPNIQEHINDRVSNPHNITKEQVGLGNVDNTADIDKPISNATLEALNNNVISEILIGDIDGINTIFNTSIPYVPGRISIFLNGIKEHNFTETNNTTIILSEAPLNMGFIDKVEAIFLKLI